MISIANILFDQIIMNLSQGPQKLTKLTLFKSITDFTVSEQHPLLLATTTDSFLSAYHLKYCDRAQLQTRATLAKQHKLEFSPTLFGFSNKRIVHCEQAVIRIDNKSQLKQKESIIDMLLDNREICVNSNKDNKICISSISKAEAITQLHGHFNEISSLYWKNSLLISADISGQLNLWDINKCRVFSNSRIHAQAVLKIGCYVDYLHSNTYYTLCPSQKRIVFYDMRTNKPISFVNNLLSSSILDAVHTQTGKLALIYEQVVDIIDIYKGFEVVGNFAQLNRSNAPKLLEQNPTIKPEKRIFTNSLAIGKYLTVGCSNGSIEVYDLDLMKCLYGFGICQFSSVKKIKVVEKSLIALDGAGNLTSTYFQ